MGVNMGLLGFSPIAVAAAACLLAAAGAEAQTISVVLPPGPARAPIDGRLVVIVSPAADPEPRLQVELEAPLRYALHVRTDGRAAAAWRTR